MYIALGVLIAVIAAIRILRLWRRRRWVIGPEIAPSLRHPTSGEGVRTVEFTHLLFFDEQHGVAIGKTAAPYDAWMYRTRDGGKHWDGGLVIGGGEIEKAYSWGEGNLVLRRSMWNREKGYSYALHLSEDYGTTWEVIDTGQKREFPLRDPARRFRWSQGAECEGDFEEDFEEELTVLEYTEDSGRGWERLPIPQEENRWEWSYAIHADGSVWYIYDSKIVRLRREKNGKWNERVFELPPVDYVHLLQLDGEKVWITGCIDKAEVLSIFRMAEEGKWECSGAPSVPYSLTTIHSHGSHIFFVGGRRGSDFGPVPDLLITWSSDGGESWNKERNSGIRARSPVAFHKNRLWTVGQDNRIRLFTGALQGQPRAQMDIRHPGQT